MLPQEIILRKRNGEPLTPAMIEKFVAGISNGALSDGQIAAFAMAVWFNGMTSQETVALTLAMRDSGDVLSWPEIDKPIADKHSTGGVGDNVSLMLAPIAAACGLAVPMISGRGLGHTGGTLDKLESIPGYSIKPDENLFRRVVKDVGCAIIGPTGDLAPADKKLYVIRDHTATVDSVPLITGSILSKKLAAGLQSLVLDVKVGNGAFMSDLNSAEVLARSLVDVANGAGVKTVALLTDMNQPLADAAGNVTELNHCLAFLSGGKKASRLYDLVIAMVAEMLVVSNIATDLTEASAAAINALESGRALECFGRMVSMLGGPADFVEKPTLYLERAPVERRVIAPMSGVLTHCNTRDIGMAVIALGGGRLHSGDKVDHRVGFSDLLPLGQRVEKGQVIATIHAADDNKASAAEATLLSTYQIDAEAGRIDENTIFKKISSS